MRLSSRLAKLETAQRRQNGVFVVSGSHEERRRQVDELIASGKAGPDSLFIHIRNLLDGETDESAKRRRRSQP
jgi:hypothetical protein